LNTATYGRSPDEPLFPELIAQGAEPRRSSAFSGRFTDYRKKTKTYRPGVDFRSYRGNVETTLRNVADVNAGWVDELIGHDSPIRRSEGARYTKSIFMANLKRTIDKITISADLSKLYYTHQQGVCAPGTAEEIVRYPRTRTATTIAMTAQMRMKRVGLCIVLDSGRSGE
jgi:porphobilinogen deaminase